MLDFSSRGTLKLGDKCEMTKQCGFAGSICYQSYCTCSPEYMSTNHVDKCGKGKINSNRQLKILIFNYNSFTTL